MCYVEFTCCPLCRLLCCSSYSVKLPDQTYEVNVLQPVELVFNQVTETCLVSKLIAPGSSTFILNSGAPKESGALYGVVVTHDGKRHTYEVFLDQAHEKSKLVYTIRLLSEERKRKATLTLEFSPTGGGLATKLLVTQTSATQDIPQGFCMRRSTFQDEAEGVFKTIVPEAMKAFQDQIKKIAAQPTAQAIP